MMTRLLALFLTLLVSLSACAALPTVEPQTPYQLIIQFRATVVDPDSPAFVQQLSEDAGAALRFLRTLATGAQLYSVDGNLDRADFSAAMQQLRRRHDVLYVEEDRRVQPATGK